MSHKKDIRWLEKLVKAEIKAIRREAMLIEKLSATAILKSEVTVTERLESHNGHLNLVKEQATHLATKQDVESVKQQISVLTKFMFMCLGGAAVVAFIIKFFQD